MPEWLIMQQLLQHYRWTEGLKLHCGALHILYKRAHPTHNISHYLFLLRQYSNVNKPSVQTLWLARPIMLFAILIMSAGLMHGRTDSCGMRKHCLSKWGLIGLIFSNGKQTPPSHFVFTLIWNHLQTDDSQADCI